jgi:hypothetical protein
MPARRPNPGQNPAEQHAEWLRLLRPDGPFLALPVLTEVFRSGLDLVPDAVRDRVRQAWGEVQDAPDLLLPAWYDLIVHELLRIPAREVADGATVPALRGRATPHQVAYGPGPDGRAMRLFCYRYGWNDSLTKGHGDQPAPVERAAALCRETGVPIALVTNGRLWALVHTRPQEATSVAVFDADLWLEEPLLLRAFVTLLDARRALAPPRRPDGSWSDGLAALFARSAEAHTQVTDTLGRQVRQAVELLVAELARLDRESGGALLRDVAEREIYRGALTVLMRLVFLLYAEEQELLPVDDRLYGESYSVGALYDRLEEDHNRYGEEVGDRRSAAWYRLLALFRAVHGGSEHPDLRIPAYGGSLFDSDTHPWLAHAAVSDRVVHEVLDALLILHHDARRRTPARAGRHRDAAERLSYKGLDVEQIGHVYEGLLEFSCLKVAEPYLGLIGQLEPELPLARVEEEYAKGRASFLAWLKTECKATPKQLEKALDRVLDADELGNLDSACDNDAGLAERVRPFASLLRRDLRGYPTVFPAGSVLFTQVGDRRSTGTHYTPRPLAEEVVQHTLAPLCYDPGPAEGTEEKDWRVKPAAELLALNIVDPAMGSGAFLVSACRYLAERLLDAWERDGIPAEVLELVGPDHDRDDLLKMAKRRVVASCIYGVDRDDMAVELAKLSLWIETVSADKPFTFLDHALRCGDSLVCLLDEAQIVNFHFDPERGYHNNAQLSGTMDEIVGPLLTRVQELREEIEATTDEDIDRIAEKEKKLKEAEDLTRRLGTVADAVCAAALATATEGNRKDKNGFTPFEQRLNTIQARVQQTVRPDIQRLAGDEEYESPVEQELRKQLTTWLKGTRKDPIKPLHWAMEFPEVMRRGGFDAVVGNPPFIGGQRLTGAIGVDLREYLVHNIGGDRRGSADLCAYFLLRDMSVTSKGRVGIIATNTIGQGDTREVGLAQAIERGWQIYRAVKSQPWEGTASLEVSLVWVGHGRQPEKSVLDGREVHAITSSLDPATRVTGDPHRLAANADQSFIGSYVLGTGFILEPEQALTLISKDPRNERILFPYLNGEDLNSEWSLEATRWVINFRDWGEEDAKSYPDAFAIVERDVKPSRIVNNRKARRERWWQFAERAVALYNAIIDLDHVLVIAQTSRTQVPVLVSAHQVFDQKLVVFPTADQRDHCFRASVFQYVWTVRQGSTRTADAVFTPSDCCETLAKPNLTNGMHRAGEELNSFRRDLMRRTRLGLTRIYNQVHNPTINGQDIDRLREIHIEIDEAVREAYALDEDRESAIREYEAEVASASLPSWREIDLGHGFYETQQGMRFTISPQARDDVLDKLLALNRYRYEQEVKQGLRKKKPRKRPLTAAALKAPDADAAVDDGLFDPPGALF